MGLFLSRFGFIELKLTNVVSTKSNYPNSIQFANEAKPANAYKLGSRRWNGRANLEDYTYLMSPNKGETGGGLSGFSRSSHTTYDIITNYLLFKSNIKSTICHYPKVTYL